MKKIYILSILLIFSLSSFGQKAEDLLRYSQQNYMSTARSAGMAGAFGALGGNFDALRINPAGLAVYRHSEISFSSSYSNIFTDFKTNNLSGNNYNITNRTNEYMLGNFGIVYAIPNYSGDQVRVVLGFGYQTINNYNREYTGQVNKSANSLLDWSAFSSNGIAPDKLYQFSDKLFYDTRLMNMDPLHANEYGTVLNLNEKVDQYQNIQESGYQGEYNFAVGVNIDQRWNLGLNISVNRIDYQRRSVYNEQTLADTKSNLDNYTYVEHLRQKGYGINAKLGIIFKATQNLRLGASVQTGTKLDTDEEYYSSATSNFNTNVDGKKSYTAKSPLNEYSYEINTPARYNLSAAYVFGQRAIISTDLELVDYGSGFFSIDENKDEYYSLNQEVKTFYNTTINWRIGSEIRINSMLSARLGYAFKQNPIDPDSDAINSKNNTNLFSTGLGFRHQNFFFNFAYVHSYYNDNYTLYNFSDGNTTITSAMLKQKIKHNNFMFSVGFNF